MTTATTPDLSHLPAGDFWQTPPEILERVGRMFPQWYDPCPANPLRDGLATMWGFYGSFINPPYSELARWVEHGLTQPREQLWLTHHKHDARWCKLLMSEASAFVMLADRVKFIDPKTGGERSTMRNQRQTAWYLGRDVGRFYDCFGDMGYFVDARRMKYVCSR